MPLRAYFRALLQRLYGRNAADAALTATFGTVTLTRFNVYADEDGLSQSVGAKPELMRSAEMGVL